MQLLTFDVFLDYCSTFHMNFQLSTIFQFLNVSTPSCGQQGNHRDLHMSGEPFTEN